MQCHRALDALRGDDALDPQQPGPVGICQALQPRTQRRHRLSRRPAHYERLDRVVMRGAQECGRHLACCGQGGSVEPHGLGNAARYTPDFRLRVQRRQPAFQLRQMLRRNQFRFRDQQTIRQ
jgi:hypothetical protein